MPIKHYWNGTILTIESDSGTSSCDLQGSKGETGARGARGLTGRTGGGALIEDGVIRDDTTWSSAGIMDRFAEAFSTEGNPVVCDNALANVPFNIITEIEPKQEGSGNPCPAGLGKNLIDDKRVLKPNAKHDSITELTLSGSTITLSGIPTNQYAQLGITNIIEDIQSLVGKTLTLSATLGGTQPHLLLTFNKNDEKNTRLDSIGFSNIGKNTKTIVVPEGTEKTTLILCLNRGSFDGTTKYTATYTDIQLEVGSTATTYEPGSNIRPIVGYDNISITRSGKNLYNPNTFTYGEPFFNSDGTAQTSTSVGVCYIPVKAGETYTITAYSQHYVRVAQLDNNKAFISGVRFALQGAENGASRTFTTTKNTAYLQIAQDKSLVKAQLETGSTATAYEPYKGETYTLSLGNTYAQGVLDWNTGELVVDKKYMVLTGNEAKGNNPSSSSTQCIWINHALTTDMAVGDYLDGYCSHFYNERKNKNVNTIRFGASVDKTIYLYLPLNNFADASAFNTYAKEQYDAGKPIQIVYPLAKPQIIKLEPQIIKALSGTNTLYTNADNLLLVGRIDTMKTIQELLARVSALEAKVGE